ncbi:pyridoxamine 5'-phosphate oxidase family protein [Salinarimonas rosea]|uniref:pyridoxamine 5'-phosphate oxidase family protein n=1 Tax=Salinarimonas rosea TaxID=552063 RepID=UPI0003FE993E|nr:pyridoxamine 5'-phosphate oxidase family protein [Salinarimonas rosea]
MRDPRDTPAFANDLDAMRAHAWRQLARGVEDRRSPFHAPTVATVGLDGRPRLRTVVLRGVEPARARLRFHTDTRSEKVAELRRDARIALHAYDPVAKLQVRIEGAAVLHTADALAEEAWRGSRMASRACYATQPAPGRAIAVPDGFDLPESEDAILAGRAQFCAVEIVAETLETLWLARDGHRRARFVRRPDGSAEADCQEATWEDATWLVP